MPTITASAKLYTGIRCWVVDKNITANLSASFSVGNQNQPSPVLVGGIPTIYANIKGDKVVRTRANIDVISSVGITNQRYATYGCGNNVITPGSPRVIDNTNAWRAVSTVVCKFPTYIRIDIEKLGLPEGEDCIVQLEEGWLLEGDYPESLKGPSPRNDSLVTFRVPFYGVSRFTSTATLANTVLRKKQLASVLSSTAAVVAYPIFNPGKLAALFGGVFFTLPTAVKTARGISSMLSTFASNTVNLKIKQLASTFDTGISTLTAESEVYNTPGPVTMTSIATISASGDRSIGVITAIVADAATMNTVAVKTARITRAITATASMSVDGFAQKGLPVTNMSMTASLSASVDVPMVLTTTDTTVQLPLWYGSINAVIEWGDGTTQTVTSTPNSRTSLVKNYSTSATRTIYIRGSVQNWGYANASQFLSNTGLGTVGTGYQVQAFGDIGIETLIAFSGNNGFNGQTPNYIPSTVKDISYFFYAATSLSNPSRLQFWNTSNVQKMEGVFRLVGGDVSAIPIGSWNTGSVTTMRRMFRNSGNDGASSTFNTDISGWNTSNVTDMSEMFMDTPSFDRNINGWDVGSVTTFEGMFSTTSAKYNQNLADWDVSSATNMSSMLFGSGTYTHDLTGWCVTNIPSEPTGWTGVTLKPIWGTCP